MVKKLDYGHCHPGICPMVNGQSGHFVFMVKLKVYHLTKFVSWLWSWSNWSLQTYYSPTFAVIFWYTILTMKNFYFGHGDGPNVYHNLGTVILKFWPCHGHGDNDTQAQAEWSKIVVPYFPTPL